jgi:hypothetical protein
LEMSRFAEVMIALVAIVVEYTMNR